MTNYEIKADPLKIYISPAGFRVYAADFLNAHQSYRPSQPFSPTSYYLICHSLELSMKAFLLAKGMTRAEIKCIGHNLAVLLKKVKELDIDTICSVSDAEAKEIRKANAWYLRKGFEYFELRNLKDGPKTLPDLKVLIKIAQSLVKDLEPLCLSVA